MKKILKLIIISLTTLICTQYTFAYSKSEHSISSEEVALLYALDLDVFWKPNSSSISFRSVESRYTRLEGSLKSDYADFNSKLDGEDIDVAIVEIYNKLVKKYPELVEEFPLDGTKAEIKDFISINFEEKEESCSTFLRNKNYYEKIFNKLNKTFSSYKINSYEDLNSYNSRYLELLHRANSNLDRAEKSKNAKDGKVSQYSMTGSYINHAATREKGAKEYEQISIAICYIENYKVLGDLILEKLAQANNLIINLEDKSKRSFDCYLIDNSNPRGYVVLSLDKKKVFNIKKENLSANCLKELAKLSVNNTELKGITLLELLVKYAEDGDVERQSKLGDLYLNGNTVAKDLNTAKMWYTKAANAGNTKAKNALRLIYILENGESGSDEDLLLLAKAYSKGNGVEKNQVKAFELYRNLAERGNAEAQYSLGDCYVGGDGVARNSEEAAKWYRKAAEQGHAEAQNNIGALYYKGFGVAQSYTEAAKWLRKAAEQGFALAQFHLGRLYYKGNGVAQSSEEAAKWYRKAAEQGYAEAQYNLGQHYKQGVGVAQNYAEAAKWFRKAAEQGDAAAQCCLGDCYVRGDGVAQSYTEAAKWHRKSAEQGDIDAQYNIGLHYHNGHGVAQSYTEAAKWYRKSAEQGDASSQLQLGTFYYKGNGVAQSYTEAAKWFRKAAEQGVAYAQTFLGCFYEGGYGVAQSYAEAAKWLRKAAEQGVAEAQYFLGTLYYKGNGVTQSNAEAAKWLRKSAEQGYKPAIEFLETH